MMRWRGELAAIALVGCNPMFGIEEGYLSTEAPLLPDAGSGPGRVEAPDAGPELSAPLSFQDWRLAPGSPLGLVANAYPAWGEAAQVTPNCADSSCFAGQPPDGLCMSGTIAAADVSTTWAQIQLPLRNSGSGELWDRAGGRVLGVAFRVEGSRIPPLRFHVHPPPPSDQTFSIYCTELQPGGRGRVATFFDDLVQDCWSQLGVPRLPREQGIQNVAWTAHTDGARSLDFAYCVRDIRLIVASE
jgi:hypothetical protein